LLRDLPQWSFQIDSTLHERYDKQLGLIFTNVKKTLRSCSEKSDIRKLLDLLAPNVSDHNGNYRHSVGVDLYKLVHGINLKAKAAFSPAIYGVRAGVVVEYCLLNDLDLKAELSSIYQKFDVERNYKSHYAVLVDMMIKACIRSVLKWLILTVYGDIARDRVEDTVPMRMSLKFGRKSNVR
jgi:hypothetical protein